MNKSIGYHTRLNGKDSQKVCGGSFGGSFDLETVNRLVKAHKYTVVVKASGTPVFVDKEGREVSLYFTVDARMTDAGKEALQLHSKVLEQRQKEEEAKENEIESIMNGMTADEILSLLRG